MKANEALVHALYLLAMINPVSKVSVLSALSAEEGRRGLASLAAKSSLVAAVILLFAMTGGDFFLRAMLRVDLYSLRLAGGIVLFWTGFNALRKGIFFERDTHARYADVAVVPLACPLIAGPATIAAVMTLRAQHGIPVAAVAMLLAVGVNHAIMLASGRIAAVLTRFNVLGAIIRITGLLVATIGAQMVLDGLREWQMG